MSVQAWCLMLVIAQITPEVLSDHTHHGTRRPRKLHRAKSDTKVVRGKFINPACKTAAGPPTRPDQSQTKAACSRSSRESSSCSLACFWRQRQTTTVSSSWNLGAPCARKASTASFYSLFDDRSTQKPRVPQNLLDDISSGSNQSIPTSDTRTHSHRSSPPAMPLQGAVPSPPAAAAGPELAHEPESIYNLLPKTYSTPPKPSLYRSPRLRQAARQPPVASTIGAHRRAWATWGPGGSQAADPKVSPICVYPLLMCVSLRS